MTDVAVDAQHVYWAQHTFVDESGWEKGTIGRANLDGTNRNQDLVTLGTHAPQFLAVDGLSHRRPAGKASAAGTQRQRGKGIHVEIKVKARVELTAKTRGKVKMNPTYKLEPKKVQVAAGKTKTLKLKPKKKAARKIATALKRDEKATAKLTVKLTDLAGNTETEKLGVRLKR